MTVFYFDASALVKRYKSEPGSEIVEALFDGHQATETFTSSYFAVLEVTAVARRLLKGRLLTRRAYNTFMARFLADVDDHLIAQSVTDEVVARSIDLVEEHALKTGDAIHLATALAVSDNLPDESVVLVAADGDLLAAAAAERVQVLNPEDVSAGQLLITLRA